MIRDVLHLLRGLCHCENIVSTRRMQLSAQLCTEISMPITMKAYKVSTPLLLGGEKPCIHFVYILDVMLMHVLNVISMHTLDGLIRMHILDVLLTVSALLSWEF